MHNFIHHNNKYFLCVYAVKEMTAHWKKLTLILKNVKDLIGMVAGGITSENMIFACRLLQRMLLRDHSYLCLMARTFKGKGLHVYSSSVMLLGRTQHPHLKIYLVKKLTRMRYNIVFLSIFCKILSLFNSFQGHSILCPALSLAVKIKSICPCIKPWHGAWRYSLIHLELDGGNVQFDF